MPPIQSTSSCREVTVREGSPRRCCASPRDQGHSKRPGMYNGIPGHAYMVESQHCGLGSSFVSSLHSVGSVAFVSSAVCSIVYACLYTCHALGTKCTTERMVYGSFSISLASAVDYNYYSLAEILIATVHARVPKNYHIQPKLEKCVGEEEAQYVIYVRKAFSPLP